MLQRLIIVLCLCGYYCFAPYVVADAEIAESSKCSKLFPYFEKKFNIPVNTLHSISLKESGKKHKNHKIVLVWPWAVNVGGKGYYFNTKREAIIFVRKQIIKGRENIDVGCMQINLKHHLDAFNSLEQAFDPNNNVKYGAEFLRLKYDQLRNWHKAIAHYHSATHSLGYKYKQDVIKIAGNMLLYKESLRKYIDNKIPEGYLVNVSVGDSKLNNNNGKIQKKSFLSNNRKYKSNMMVTIPGRNQ